MVTIGSCCNNDYRQGPEHYIEDKEDLSNKDIIIWYVAQMYNDNRPGIEYCWASIVPKNGKAKTKFWPGTVGLLFKPFKKQK